MAMGTSTAYREYSCPINLSWKNPPPPTRKTAAEKDAASSSSDIKCLTFFPYPYPSFVNENDITKKEYQWKCFKQIPHCFNDDKSLRFFATNNDEYKEICVELLRLFDPYIYDMVYLKNELTGFANEYLKPKKDWLLDLSELEYSLYDTKILNECNWHRIGKLKENKQYHYYDYFLSFLFSQ